MSTYVGDNGNQILSVGEGYDKQGKQQDEICGLNWNYRHQYELLVLYTHRGIDMSLFIFLSSYLLKDFSLLFPTERNEGHLEKWLIASKAGTG